jgi:hypothetical protein
MPPRPAGVITISKVRSHRELPCTCCGEPDFRPSGMSQDVGAEDPHLAVRGQVINVPPAAFGTAEMSSQAVSKRHGPTSR